MRTVSHTLLLRRYSQFLVSRLADMAIAPLLPSRTANLLQVRLQNWRNYFEQHEEKIDEQWNDIIWPLIKEFDFSSVLELSPGAGRSTEKLAALSSRLIAVDISQDALNQARARLGTKSAGCQISYHRNNGADLPMVGDESVTAIYCWDSAVHFEKGVVMSYLPEFARVLKPGGSGFFHHSTLGEGAHKNIKRNPHWRSNVSKEMVAEGCEANGLRVTMQQPVPWPPIVDCVTIFRKPA